MTTSRSTASVALIALGAAALMTTRCSPSSPGTGPTTILAVSGIALTPSTSASGTTVGGVVTLTGTAPAAGATVTLASANPAVATVPASLVIPGGVSIAPFVVTAVSTGTSAITATMNGVAGTATLTVTARTTLQSLTLNANSVVGGDSVTGTVTLTDVAPAVGAVVALLTGDPVAVPASVTVPGGQRTITFSVLTRAVGGSIAANITASYGGVSASAPLSVTAVAPATAAVAGFGITGSSITDTCLLTNGGNSMDCAFDGSLSRAPGTIVAWDWSYSVATTLTQTTTGPILSGPAANCGFLPPPPLAEGFSSFPLTVRLTIRDSLGNVSATVVYDGARVLPNGFCGY